MNSALIESFISLEAVAEPCLFVQDEIIVYINDCFIQLSEFSEKDILGKNITYVLNQLLRIRILKENYECDAVKNIDCYLFTKNNLVHQVTISAHSNPFANETEYRFTIQFNSILDETFSIIEELHQSNGAAVALFSVPDFVQLKANINYFTILKRYYNITEQSIGIPIKEFMPHWESSKSKRLWDKTIVKKETFYCSEYKINRPEVQEVFMDYTLTPIKENNEVKYLLLKMKDITEFVKNKQLLEEKNKLVEQHGRLLETIIENMSDGVFLMGQDGTVKLYNQEAKNFLYDESSYEKLGDSLKNTHYYGSSGNKLSKEDLPVHRILTGERIKSMRLTAAQPHRTQYYTFSGCPIYDNSGSITAALVCFSDITEQVENDEKIKTQQRAQIILEQIERENLEKVIMMKDEFLSIVSHEFKTPLTIIDAAAQSIEKIYYNEASPKVKDLVGKIHQNSFRLLRLVNNLLDITRFDADQIKMHKKNMDIVKLTRTIVESVGLYAVQKDIQLGFYASMRSKTIAIDDEKYERIILNLLSNAVKFTPRGKAVSVAIYCDKKHVYIEVKDEGVGIPKDKQKLIFERFGQVDSSLTRQAEGTGLGLTIVKALVTKFNGEITVNSEFGKGSTFTVKLPISKVRKNSTINALVNLADNSINKDVDVEFSDVYFD